MTEKRSRVDASVEGKAEQNAKAGDVELASLRRQLETAKQEMQAFAYSVSHDLRAPIRAIEGFSKIILEDFGDGIDPEAKRFLQHIISNTQILSNQIEDLLRFYRISKVVPNKLPVEAKELFERVAQDELAKAKNTVVKVDITDAPQTSADPELLRQALSELVGNAIKYSSKVKEPRITLGGGREGDENVLWVKDNGVGFDEKYSAKLFQVFQKLHPVAEYPGNGIGLAMTRRIVEMQGGRVWAQGKPGEGAKFYVAFPVNP
jgi:light-regulated signal transduction histidine kinase (bacteriophytochrome)